MKVIYKYFKTWWLSLLAYVFPALIFIIGTLFKSNSIIDIALIILLLNILGTIVSAIVQIFLSKWYFAIPQVLISGILFFYISFFFTFSPPDYYGANKTIPINIKIEVPIDREINERDLSADDFKLVEIGQPGIYNYYTNYHPKELGSFFIKAYEITSNERLSEETMTKRSNVVVENLTEKVYRGEFTIYEGSWGDKYAARLELWYTPVNGNEYKITEKNYIVEGWMR